MEILQYDDFRTEKITALINARSTFEIVGVSGNMGSTIRILETTIESAGLKCRVYTQGRIAAAGATFLGGATGFAGMFATLGIAAHNLATYNPDYEIVKHVVDGSISVRYKK